MPDEHKCEVDWSTFTDLREAVRILKDVLDDVVFELQIMSESECYASINTLDRLKRKMAEVSRYL